MAERPAPSVALGAIGAGLAAIAASYGSAFFVQGGAPWSTPAFAIGMNLAAGGLMALGASRRGRLGRLWIPILATVAIVTAGLLAAWLLPPVGEPLWLGLPRRAAIVLYGVGLLPMFVLPVAYAVTFERLTLRGEDIERVRAERAAMLRVGDPPDDGAAAR